MHMERAQHGQILYISEQQQQQTIPCALHVKLQAHLLPLIRLLQSATFQSIG
jgi:hypothetical protein